MSAPSIDPRAALASAVDVYRSDNDLPVLLEKLFALTASADLDALIEAVEPYRTVPEVAGPVYERVVAERPTDARALVALANAYWLTGRGPEATGALAARAIAADPAHRGAWHLWALTEPAPRDRLARWRQVTARFPGDELALANLADNAVAIATAEHDDEALALAIESYESLLQTAERPEQRSALEGALGVLRRRR